MVLSKKEFVEEPRLEDIRGSEMGNKTSDCDLPMGLSSSPTTSNGVGVGLGGHSQVHQRSASLEMARAANAAAGLPRNGDNHMKQIMSLGSPLQTSAVIPVHRHNDGDKNFKSPRRSSPQNSSDSASQPPSKKECLAPSLKQQDSISSGLSMASSSMTSNSSMSSGSNCSSGMGSSISGNNGVGGVLGNVSLKPQQQNLGSPYNSPKVASLPYQALINANLNAFGAAGNLFGMGGLSPQLAAQLGSVHPNIALQVLQEQLQQQQLALLLQQANAGGIAPMTDLQAIQNRNLLELQIKQMQLAGMGAPAASGLTPTPKASSTPHKNKFINGGNNNSNNRSYMSNSLNNSSNLGSLTTSGLGSGNNLSLSRGGNSKYSTDESWVTDHDSILTNGMEKFNLNNPALDITSESVKNLISDFRWSNLNYLSPEKVNGGNNPAVLAENHRKSAASSEATCTWVGQLPPKNCKNPNYSCKVFLGGVPWDITEQQLQAQFKMFGAVTVDWPGKDKNNAKCPPSGSGGHPGYVYLIFENEKAIRSLLQACSSDYAHGHSSGEYYFKLSSRRNRSKEVTIKEVQVIPWVLADSNFSRVPAGSRTETTRTVFVGALHGMLNAEALANIMNDLFGGVTFAGIDTDKYKYPIGSGRVSFNNDRSYMKAVSAGFIEIKANKFTKKVQVDPYLDDHYCSSCGQVPGQYFCRETTCFTYFCLPCWNWQHSIEAFKPHVPLTRNSKMKNAIVPPVTAVNNLPQTNFGANLSSAASVAGSDITNSSVFGGLDNNNYGLGSCNDSHSHNCSAQQGLPLNSSGLHLGTSGLFGNGASGVGSSNNLAQSTATFDGYQSLLESATAGANIATSSANNNASNNFGALSAMIRGPAEHIH